MTKDEQLVSTTNTLANAVALTVGVAMKVSGDTAAEVKDVTSDIYELVGAKIQQRLAPLGE